MKEMKARTEMAVRPLRRLGGRPSNDWPSGLRFARAMVDFLRQFVLFMPPELCRYSCKEMLSMTLVVI
jgi:hypothetical protein